MSTHPRLGRLTAAILLPVMLTVCSSASSQPTKTAQPQNCPDGSAVVAGADTTDLVDICQGVAGSLAFLASFGVLPTEPISIEVTHRIPEEAGPTAAGCYIEQRRRVFVVPYSTFRKNKTWFGVAVILPELQALEVELHHPGVRCSHERLEQLLHPEFHEVGRSGRAYDRTTIVNYLAAQEVQPVVASDAFAVAELGPGTALLTYRSAHVEAGDTLVNHTLRSSIWLKTAAGWQLRYHQGTAAAEAW